MSDGQDTLAQKLDSEARQLYSHVTPAYAFVFRHMSRKGLRLEAPDLLLEFSNGVPLGRGLFSKTESRLGTVLNTIDRS